MPLVFDPNKDHRKQTYDPANYRRPVDPNRPGDPPASAPVAPGVTAPTTIPDPVDPRTQPTANARQPSQPVAAGTAQRLQPALGDPRYDAIRRESRNPSPSIITDIASATPGTAEGYPTSPKGYEGTTASDILSKAGIVLTPKQKADIERVMGMPGLFSDFPGPPERDASYQAELDRVWGAQGKTAPIVTPEQESRWRDRQAKKDQDQARRDASQGSITFKAGPDSEAIVVRSGELETRKGKDLVKRIKEETARDGMVRGTRKITLGGKSYDIPANFDPATVIEEAERYRKHSVDSGMTMVLSYAKALEMAVDTHKQVHGDNTVTPTITDENGQEVDLDGWMKRQRVERATNKANRTGKRVQVDAALGGQFNNRGAKGSNLYNTDWATDVNPAFAKKAPGSKKNDLTKDQYGQMQTELKANRTALLAAKGDKAAQAKLRKERIAIGKKYQTMAKDQVAKLSELQEHEKTTPEAAPASSGGSRSGGSYASRVRRAQATADKVTRANSVKMLSEGIRVSESELADAKAAMTRADRHYKDLMAHPDDTVTAWEMAERRRKAFAAVEGAKAEIARLKAQVTHRRSRSNSIATTAAILPGGGYAGKRVNKSELAAIRAAIETGDPDKMRDPWIADAYFRLDEKQRDEMRELARQVKARQGA